MTPKSARPKREVPTAPKATGVFQTPAPNEPYSGLVTAIEILLEHARRTSSRAANTIMTATYWEIGRRIVEYEQGGDRRAAYGTALLKQLAFDLTQRHRKGFGVDNLERFRNFYFGWPDSGISATPSRNFQTPSEISGGDPILQTVPAESPPRQVAPQFPLPWSAYVRLLSLKSEPARRFYETEALRGGWSVRQLDRQINSQFYERTALSRNKVAMLRKGAIARPDDAVPVDEEVKDPYVLEFLGLRDEYSETDLEEALIRHLESFLMELGPDFCFVGRQKRLRIGDEWFRVDLLFFHRRLHCLVLVDLKLGRFTHADAGQMHTYLNYATQHWTRDDENPPIGLILCSQRDEALARYALGNVSNKVVAAEYQTALPDEKLLADNMEKARRTLERRGAVVPRK